MKKILCLLLTISICQVLYGQGGVGIGTTNPHAPLQFANGVSNRKIVLFEGNNNDHQYYGFGVNGNILRYQTDLLLSDHVFYAAIDSTASTELMRITGLGNVGVGVTAPLNRIDLHKDLVARSGIHSIDQTLYVTGDFLNGKGVQFRQTDGTQGIGFSHNSIYAAGSNEDQDMGFASKGSNGKLLLTTNGIERVRITGSGMIGIGNGIPHAPLQFSQAPVNRKIVLFEGNNNDHQFSGFGINPGGHIRYQSADILTDHIFYAGDTPTDSRELFRIRGTGHIGMGVASPMNKLDIRFGPIRTGIHPTGLAAYITSDLTANQNVEIRNFDATQGVGIGIGSIYATGSNSSHNLSLNAKGPNGQLSFMTGGTERMKIASNGFLGFGVTNPLSILDVHWGPTRSGGHGTGRALYVTGVCEFRSYNAEEGLAIYSNEIFATGSLTSVTLGISAKGPTGDIILKTSGVERMRITADGKVGIGYFTPNAPLQFDNGEQNRKIVLKETTNNDHQYFGFGVNTNILRYQTNNSMSDHVFYSAIDGTNSQELLRIRGNGNVGIGVASPNAPLQFPAVSGNRKIVLFEAGNNDHQFIGFGVDSSGALRYQTALNVNDHVFYTATSATTSNELMRIRGTGEVGMGVVAPMNKLDIHYGTPRTGVHGANAALYVTGGGEFRSADATTGIGIGTNNIFATGSNANVDLTFAAKGTSGKIILNANNTEKVWITNAGKVGIGIASPNAPLQFPSLSGNRKIVLYEAVNNDHQFIGFGVDDSGALRYQTAFNGNDHVFYTATSAMASNELMRIRGTGNVAIAGIIENEAVIVPPLLNGFSQFGAGFAAVSYYKDKEGIVHVRGMANVPVNPIGLSIFNLPAGYRPSTSGAHVFMTMGNNVATRVDVASNGNVIFNAGTVGWVSLDGISFRAD